MKAMLAKEFRLAMHPTSLIFLLLSAMLLIPDYPYYVTFFYATLGIFFTCLNGRENHDIEYAMSLPVCKRDIVRARILYTVCMEGLQLLCAIPFAALRQSILPVGNHVGMDANIAFFGLALVMLAIFNLIFFPRYYAHPERIGGAFVLGSVAEFLFMGVVEVLTHVVPVMRDHLDTPDTLYVGEKLVVLLGGMVIFGLATWGACRISERRFEVLDL